MIHVFFTNLQECHYPVQRGEVLQNPCLRPHTRKISKSSAKASDLEILLVLGLQQGFCNTSPLWMGYCINALPWSQKGEASFAMNF